MNPPDSPRPPGVQELLARGLAHQQAGEYVDAGDFYEAALELAPHDATALGLLGTVEVARGRPAQAIPLLERSAALAPGNASTLFNLGLQLRILHRPAEALGWIERALALRPASLAFMRERAQTQEAISDNSCAASGRWRELLAAADAVLGVAPNDVEALYSRGRALVGLDEPAEARGAFSALLRIVPGHTDALMQLGHCHRVLNAFDEAHAAFARVLETNPGDTLALLNIGNVTLDQGRPDEAADHYIDVLRVLPDDLSAWMNVAVARMEAGRFDEALHCFDEALAIRPGWSRALFSKGLCLLRTGDLAAGWAGHELRLEAPVVPWEERDFGCPAWDGIADVARRTVLVWAEQGLGDAIHFSRYASALARLGARVVLEVHTPLVHLLGSLEGVSRVLPFGHCDEPCDFHCPLMSLPHLLGQVHDYEIPFPAQYLRADDVRISEWSGRMAPDRNVGIAWTGNPKHTKDFRRSVPLAQLLAHLPAGIQWWCIQKDVREADVPLLERATNILRPRLGDFDDTAALVANLDAVITVDTSIAHLAGALGKPTLLLLAEPSEWRWQTHRTDTPWYASVRLFRQHSFGDWDSAIADAVRHLGTLTRRAEAPTFSAEAVWVA